MDKVILHCDLNNFYASVEILLNPELRGKPVAVCGDPKKRHGIVLAKSNPAKAKGVQTGEAIWQALKKCPDLILVPPTYSKYVEYSGRVREVYKQYTDLIEGFGIDECWLDVTGSTRLFGAPAEIADKIRRHVKDATGLTISVGVSFNKIFAKLGSDMKKPDAVTVISRENYKTQVWPLPVSDLLMIGRKTADKLRLLNISTIGDLATADRTVLRYHFGITADKMIDAAAGNGDRTVSRFDDYHEPKSVGHGTTMASDVDSLERAVPVIYALSEMVASRLRKYGLQAGGVSVSVKNNRLQSFTRQALLPAPTSNASDIADKAIEILKANCTFSPPVRALSVYTQKLSGTGTSPLQFSLLEEDQKSKKENELEKSIDKIRNKYGFDSVKRAIVMDADTQSHNLTDDEDFLPFKR